LNQERIINLSVTGVIPCFNSEETLERSILSLKAQSIVLHEIIVINDGSTDRTMNIAANHGCRIISLENTLGRGHARMLGICESNTPFVLFCDSSNAIDNRFVERALQHLSDHSVSACFGRIVNDPSLQDSMSMWRSRHLFRESEPCRSDIHNVDTLITYAVLLRKEHVIKVGNFNPKLKECEDQELGDKLLDHEFKLLSDPQLIAYSIRKESISTLCLRYRRWHTHYKDSHNIIAHFLSTLKTSFFIFARQDLKDSSFKCLFISIYLPFYLLFHEIRLVIRSSFKNGK
jgi:glycosyltransferase involved in cell wall biosynthesis